MNETSGLKKILDFSKYSALALLPILDMYTGISSLNLGFSILLVIAVVEIVLNRGKFEFNRQFLFFMAIMIALNIVDGFIHMSSINIVSTYNNTIYVLAIAVIGAYYVRSNIVDRERLFKYVCVIGVVSCLFIFVQYVFYLRGTVIYGFIPGLNLERVVKDPYDVSITYGRPTSFFREPAYFAIYIMPIYTLCLHRRKFLLSILFLAGLLVSTSSTGLFGALVVTGIFIYKEKKIPIIIKWVLAIIGVVLLIQFIPMINKSSVVDKLKFVNLATNTRVFGTLQYFQYFGLKEIFMGVGLNELSNYLKQFTTQDIANYANSLFFSFFSFGLVGGSIWTYYVVRLHKLSRFKSVYFIFVVVYMSDQILFNRNLIYLLILLHVFADREENSEPVVTEP